jgi:putative modified peptide
MSDTPLTPELVDKLLDKLSSDDKFRSAFEHDPVAAVMELGARQPFTAGRCLRPKHLASKEEIRKSRAIIRDKLLDKGGHSIFCLEA